MRRSTLTSLLVLCLVTAAPAWAQPSPGELTVVLSSLSTEALDPILAGHIVKFYLSLMFDYLVGATPDGQLSRDGGVATRWEASADGKRWTFHLRRGVRFHTGDELTAEDVKFSILRALGPRSTTGYAQGLRQLVKEIETPAPDRVVIVTKDTTAMIPTLLSRLLSTEGMIPPKQYVEAKGDDGLARGGPVRPVVVVPRDQVQDHAGDGLRPRSGAREEAPRRRGLRERLSDRHLRLPAPRLPRGAGDGRGDRRLLAARGAQAAAHPGGLPRVPQAVVRSHGARRPRLLQHREPRLDRHLRADRQVRGAEREVGVHPRPRARQPDGRGHPPGRPREDVRADALDLQPPPLRAPGAADRLLPHAVRDLEAGPQVEPGRHHVRAQRRRAARREVRRRPASAHTARYRRRRP